MELLTLNKLFADAGFELTDGQTEDFEKYASLLVEWNEKINLTAIVEPSAIAEKHFLDSVLPLKMLEFPENASVIDVGTGAGFPSVPMKILRDDIKLTLLDSLNKRINFLNEVSSALNLSSKCIHARAEEGGKMPELREKFDIATARAVAALPILAEYCLPFVKVGGAFLALKGPNEDVDAAKPAIKLLGGKIEKIEKYTLPCGDERALIIVRKISQTSPKFPRNSGQISKKAL